MRTHRATLLLAALAAIVWCTPRTSAHHAFAAEFDSSKPIKLRGTVVKMEWINPHTWLHLDVKRVDGKTERWMIEGGPPNALYRRGFNKDSLPVGSEKTASWRHGRRWCQTSRRGRNDHRSTT